MGRLLLRIIAVGLLAIAPDIALASIVLETSASPSPAISGQTLTLTVKVKGGPFSLTNVLVTNTVPPMSTYVPGSATDGGSETAGVVTWPTFSLPATQEVFRSFQVVVDPLIGADTILFFDDMESGAANWVVSHAAGTADWGMDSATPLSGATSWFGPDVNSISDQRVTTASSLGLPPNALLRFIHRYETEDGFDGGIVEISTDGSTWTDLEGDFVQGGYNGLIDCCFGNPLADGNSELPAFTGQFETTFESVADLSSFFGSNVDFRFRMGTDGSFSDLGWLFDDVAVVVGDVTSLPNDAAVTTFEGFSSTIRGLTLVAAGPAPIPALPKAALYLLAAGLLLVVWRKRIGLSRQERRA